MFKFFLIIFGIVLVMLSVFRHVSRRREFGKSYSDYIDKIKYPPLSESNEFGQKVKWIVEPDEQTEESHPGSTEPPAGEGG